MLTRRTTLKAILGGLAGLFGLGVGRPAHAKTAAPAADPFHPYGSEWTTGRLPDGGEVFYGKGVSRTDADAAAHLTSPPLPGYERIVAQTAPVAHGVAWRLVDAPRGVAHRLVDVLRL